jgi:hypothetical protein
MVAPKRIAVAFVAALFACLGTEAAQAQSFMDQEALGAILDRRAESLDELPEVYYDYYLFGEHTDNTVVARNRLYKTIGDGNVERGRKRAKLVELLNRSLIQDAKIGDTLVVPTRFGLDLRAYSPFPRYYPGARELDKLFIMHRKIQAFAAYENGKLVRWGIINTGDPDKTATPTGRYNFNWKTEYRVSTLSPPDNPWEMYWVFNFHDERGMHVHQYQMPTGGPASHGCVRLVDADARWVYHWADGWETASSGSGVASRGRILEQGTTVLVIGDNPTSAPRPFTFKRRYPILKRIELPGDPYDVPPGSDQQRRFDRKRGLLSSSQQ